MKVGCYVTVDDSDNYVTFHGLNVRIKIKTITKAQLDSVSNRELKRGLNRTAVLFLLVQGLGRANLFSIFLSANNVHVGHAEEVWVLWNLVIYTL